MQFLWTRERRPPYGAGASGAEEAGPLARLVLDLSPLPAMLLNHRFDILAWNPEMAGLMLDFGTLPPEHRNSLWLCTLHPGLRDFYRDRERTLREGIAGLRASWAAHLRGAGPDPGPRPAAGHPPRRRRRLPARPRRHRPRMRVKKPGPR
ncbi:hypothetical protein [Nonomuraea sp. NPDC005650]|uniref:MmyB family transcriptional regulator n=1 Tax=Nonomuraea sp. NPDC005650 TaxID=3157045 RepID=UPI0033A69E72